MRNKATSYVLTAQYPTELHSKAIEIKDGFFNSFRIVPELKYRSCP